MSLLMQALKKAENAKQKQANLSATDAPQAPAAPSPQSEEFSLSPKEPEPKAPDAESDPATHNATGLDALGFALAPVATPIPASIHAEPFLPVPELPSAEPARPDDFDDLDQRPAKFIPPANLPSNDTENARFETEHRSDTSPNAMSQQLMAKIKLEQQKAAAQTEQKTVAAQQKAKTVFASKQAPRSRRAVVMGALGLIVLAVFAGSGYLYLQTMSPATTTFVKAPQPTAAPLPTVAVAPAIEPPPTSVAPVQNTTTIPARNETDMANDSRQNSNAARATRAAVATAPEARSNVSPAPAQQVQAAPLAEAQSIQVRQTTTDNRINPSLTSAYQAFTTGDLASAQQQYQKVLQQDPNNRDALLGMAAISLTRKQAQQAGAFYVKLLELDPTDPEAIAGLTSLQTGDPSQNESRLKKVLAQNPQASPVLFALGNLYAQQSRWPEAQQSYFRAFGLAPANADYAFNLAVSLDRLNQDKLALDFYQRALTLLKTSPGNFNKVAVQDRISELQSQAGS